MQFHQGQHLKNLIDKSRFTVAEIVRGSGVPKSTLYDMYEKPEIFYAKIEPLLNFLDISREKFYTRAGNVMHDEPENETQFTQVINLLKKHIDQQQEIITLLKKRK